MERIAAGWRTQISRCFLVKPGCIWMKEGAQFCEYDKLWSNIVREKQWMRKW
jgi:hypothetical protein